MQRVRSWVKKFIVLSIFFVLFFALSINVARQLTPALNEHKAWFSKMISEILHSPVQIERVRLTWFRYQPVLTFDDVTVFYQRENKSISTLSVRQVRVFFSLFKSVWNRKVQTSGVIIDGVKVKAVRRDKSRIFVDDIPFSTDFEASSFKPDFELQELLDWFSQQTGVAVRNAWVRYEDELNQKKYTFFVNELAFLNANAFHYWKGHAQLQGSIPMDADFAVKWDGELTNLETLRKTLRARFYVNLSGVDLASAMNALPFVFPHELQDNAVKQWGDIQKGSGVFKIWLNWHRGNVRSAQTEMDLRHVEWLSPQKKTHFFPRIRGQLGYKKQDNVMVLAGDDLYIDFPNRLWPATYFYLEWRDQIVDRLQMGYVNLGDVLPIALPYLTKEHARIISNMNLDGGLEQIKFVFDPDHAWTLKEARARLMNVNFQFEKQRISGLSASFQFQKDRASFDLNSKNLHWNERVFDELAGQFELTEPMQVFDCLEGALRCTHALHPVLSMKQMHAKNADFQLDSIGNVTIHGDQTLPDVDFSGTFQFDHVKHLSRYLPVQFMESELVTWLSNAFKNGSLHDGRFVLKGNLNDFPFDQANAKGRFSVEAYAKNVDFYFAPKWPPLLNGSASLQLINQSLHIYLDQAELEQITAKNFEGHIHELLTKKPAVVDVKGTIQNADLAQGLTFLHSSPLEKNIGKKLKELTASGDVELDLELHVPIRFPEKTRVNGRLTFHDVELAFPAWKLAVNRVNGTCFFDENRFDSLRFPLGLSGTVWNNPILFSIETQFPGKPEALLSINFSLAKARVEDIKTWLLLKDERVKNLHGETSLQGRASVLMKKNQPMELSVASDLKGISIENNAFIKKSEADSVHFSSRIIFSDPLKARVVYDEKWNAAVLFSHANHDIYLKGLSISLGSSEAPWPSAAGLFLYAHFDRLTDEMVQAYTQQDVNNESFPLPLKGAFLSANNVDAYGLILKNTRLSLTSTEKGYQALLNSNHINGTISLHETRTKRWNASTLFSKFKVELSQRKSSKPVSVKDLERLEALQFSASELVFRNVHVPNFRFMLTRNRTGFQLESTGKNSDMTWVLKGAMRAFGTLFQSDLNGHITLNKTDLFLKQMDLVKDALAANHSETEFSLRWNDHLFSPRVNSLSGVVTITVDHGSILHVEKQSGGAMNFGRLLSLLSVENLPRHLIFDFRDIGSGYVFDGIKGQFKLKNGEAYTNDFAFRGPIANIYVSGRIGLSQKEVDLKLYVHPSVSAASLPVAASLIAGYPAVGAAVLLLSNVTKGLQNTEAERKNAPYGYSIKGNWSAPVWREVK